MSVTAPVAAPKDNREKLLERAMSRHHYSGDALIEVLHTAQELFGFLPPPLLKTVAHKLRLPLSHVLGVATFYHFFSLKPKASIPSWCASARPATSRARWAWWSGSSGAAARRGRPRRTAR